VLVDAETTLGVDQTNDFLNHAYIHYLWGRTLRFKGEYLRAEQRFSQAIHDYRKEAELRKGPVHRLVLRAMQGQARAMRLRASTLPNEGAAKKLRIQVAKLLHDARAEAENLKASLHDRAKILIGQAYLALDDRNYEGDTGAKQQTEEILKLYSSDGDTDPSILSRVHLLRFKIDIALMTSSYARHRSGHMEAGIQEAAAALQFAEQANNRRLRARAYIAQGHVALLRIPHGDILTAREWAAKAEKELTVADQDYIRTELSELKERLDEDPQIFKIDFPFTLTDLYRTKLPDGEYTGGLDDFVKHRLKEHIIQKIFLNFENATQMRTKIGTAPETSRMAVGKLDTEEARKWLNSGPKKDGDDDVISADGGRAA
jgi:tetratricopeptide (TPR) repeat protein